jgi:hypothetical protein
MVRRTSVLPDYWKMPSNPEDGDHLDIAAAL